MAVLGLTAVHAAYWTDLRMRAPLVPAIALIAAAGVVRFAADPPAAGRVGTRPEGEGEGAGGADGRRHRGTDPGEDHRSARS
jgi:hypothetical protein